MLASIDRDSRPDTGRPLRLTGRPPTIAFVVVALVSVLLALGWVSPALATFPDRNGLIAFSAATDDGVQIFTIRQNGHGLHQITHGAGDAQNLDWSPDGRKIVFGLGTETAARLATVNADGSGLTILPQPPDVFEDQPSYSPDGKRIYFERFTVATNDDAIWSMRTDGSDQHRLIGPPENGFVTDPNISPDGKTLAFSAFDGVTVGPPPVFEAGLGLFTARIDGTHVTQIRPNTADETIKVDWAPDGRRIAATENANLFNPDTSPNIVTMRPDGTRLHSLTTFNDPAVRAYLGSYSPDGDWIVFRLEDHGQFGLFRMRPDGTGVRTILPMSDFKPFLIDWGPRAEDGRH